MAKTTTTATNGIQRTKKGKRKKKRNSSVAIFDRALKSNAWPRTHTNIQLHIEIYVKQNPQVFISKFS